LWRRCQKFVGVRHQCGSDLPAKVGCAARLVVEGAKDRKRAGVKAYSELCDGARLGCNEVLGAREEGCNFVLLSWLRLEFDIE
jgi:hypothetical protein